MIENKFFEPSSVAIIGASSTKGKVGNDLIKNLIDFPGKKWGVNPKGGIAYGIEFFSSLSLLPETPDLAIISVPAEFVINVLEECGEKKIKNIIIISAGFRESGNKEREDKLNTIASKYSMNILGPNCLGLINPYNSLNASFSSSEKIKKGNIALVSQSGSMAVAIMDWAKSSLIGFSKIISMGNKLNINESDLLEYLEKDDKTDIILLYLEDITDGKKFYKICKRLSKKKTIITIKSGISKKGSLAAHSHTGALSGEKQVLKTAFSQAGIHSTNSLKDFFLWGQMFSLTKNQNIPEDVMIITNAGGIGVMAVDNAEKYGVKLTEFTLDDKKILSVNMPNSSSFNNPIDILGDAKSDRYEQILNNSLNLKKQNFAYLILLTPQTTTDYDNIADNIINFSKQHPEKCIMTCFIGGESLLKTRKKLKSSGILHFNYPKDALKAYKKALLQREWECIPSEFSPEATCFYSEDIEEIKSLLKKENKLCSASIVSKIMKSFDISFAEEILIKNIYDIDEIWDQLNIKKGMRAVMKISSPDIAHKTDIDGVVLDIKSKEYAKESFRSIIQNARIHRPNAEIKGVTIQKMFDKSREVFVGMTRDPIFGELMIFGFGGIYLNVFEDVSRKIAPVSPYEIKKMIKEIKYYTILKGTRGEKPIDFEKLEDLIFRLSCMFHTLKEIESIDMNPIFCTENDAYIIDAKIFVKDNSKNV